MTAQPIERAAARRESSRRSPLNVPADPTFEALGVPSRLVRALADGAITAPFPIQSAVLPDALGGFDILGRGRTGSGKTLAFCIPLAARLAGGRTVAGRPRGLVLVPTRELANQVHACLLPLAQSAGLSITTIFGGTPQGRQVTALRRRVDIVVACPGRLADLIEQGHCDLGDVEISVVDEADHMADLGFLPVVRRLLDATPPGGQRMLFSATLDSAVDVLVRRFLNDPAVHSIDHASVPESIVHHLLTVAPGDRNAVVDVLAGGNNRTLVFTRTKHGAHRLARQLSSAGTPAAELHGDLSQRARERSLAAFAAGTVRVLVATDIAARGIHVDDIGLVIHADSPVEPKSYLHRSGRTARAGAGGVVVTLQTAAQSKDVRALMRKAGVVPLAANASPHSPILRSIAGEPAQRTDPPASPPAITSSRPGNRAARSSGGGRTGRQRSDRPATDSARGGPWSGRRPSAAPGEYRVRSQGRTTPSRHGDYAGSNGRAAAGGHGDYAGSNKRRTPGPARRRRP